MAVGSSQSSNIYPPQSPTRITNNSILKLSGAFHCVKTSSMRFCAFSYSTGEPCERSDQLSIYFKGILPVRAEIPGTTVILDQPALRGWVSFYKSVIGRSLSFQATRSMSRRILPSVTFWGRFTSRPSLARIIAADFGFLTLIQSLHGPAL